VKGQNTLLTFLLLLVANDGKAAPALVRLKSLHFRIQKGAGGTGIEPVTCGFGESGTAFFPVLFRLASWVRPDFKPFLVSGRLGTSESPAVKSAVNALHYFPYSSPPFRHVQRFVPSLYRFEN
jgi:hypothetical protein